MSKHFFTPFRLVLLFFLAALCALPLLPRLDVALNPSPKTQSLRLSFRLANSPPETVEQVMTAPLENLLSQIEGLKGINSSSGYHRGEIQLLFAQDVALDYKRFEVASLLREFRENIPPNGSYPQIEAQSAEAQQVHSPLLTYSLNAPMAAEFTQNLAQRLIIPQITQIEGVEQVKLSGLPRPEICFRFSSEKLIKYKISRNELQQFLENYCQQAQIGKLRASSTGFIFAYFESKFPNTAALSQLAIRPNVLLKDLGTFYLQNPRANYFYRINGRNSVNLQIFAKEQANALSLSKAIKQKMGTIQQKLPPQTQVFLEYDSSEYLAEELEKIYQRTAWSLLILAALVILVHRRLSYLLVLFTSLLVNLALSALLLYFGQIEIHLYSLAGLTLSFGLIMDNAIVRIDALVNRGKPVMLALLGASLSSIAALLLVFSLPENIRENLSDFALIVSLNLGVSLLVAWQFSPAIYALFQSPQSRKTSFKTLSKRLRVWQYYYGFLLKIRPFRAWLNLLVILGFGLPVMLLPAKVEGENWEWYRQSIGSDFYQYELRPYVDFWLGGTLRLFFENVFESYSYRSPEKTKLYLEAEMPFGSNIEQMNANVAQLEAYLLAQKGISKLAAWVYAKPYARLEVSFSEAAENSSFPYQLRSRLIAKSLEWGGIQWKIYGVGRGFSNEQSQERSRFTIKMKGYNYLDLGTYADSLAQKLVQHKRVQAVETNAALSYQERGGLEYQFQLDPRFAADFRSRQATLKEGLSYQQIALNPQQLLNLGDKTYILRLESQAADNFSEKKLLQVTIPMPDSSRLLSLAAIGELKLEQNSTSLHKENRQYLRLLQFDYYGSYRFGLKYSQQVVDDFMPSLPAGYQVQLLENNAAKATKSQEYLLLLWLLLLLYMICAAVFESLYLPFFVLATIPLSFIGLFVGFGYFGFYFDQGGYAAFILLGGIVANASIFILREYQSLSYKTSPRKRAVRAVFNKLTPILLTTFSSILGLIPFLSSGDGEVFWFALALGSISGLLTSLPIVSILLPLWLMPAKK